MSGVLPGDSFSFPFLTGKKIGHCVEATVGWGTSTGSLLTGNDLVLGKSGDPANAIGEGLTKGAQQIEWILLSSYKDSPSDASGKQAAAHQSAIWQLTNPSSGSFIKTGVSDVDANATKLLNDSATYFAHVNNTAGLSVDGGSALATCDCTTRSVTVTGSPWTDAALTLSGPGSFLDADGKPAGASMTVNLGASGSTQVLVQDTTAGAFSVSATIQTATMVQANNGGNQNFVYLEFLPTTQTVTFSFKHCADLQVANTANPTLDRAYSWTILKSVKGPSTATGDAGSTVGFDYTIAVTKGSAVDANWALSGTISVTNPNAFPVTGTVLDDVQNETTDTCVITGGASQTFPANATTPVAYTCSFSGQPSYGVLTNHATVTWQKDGLGSPSVNSGDRQFQFNTGSIGNPSITHDAIDVYDAFNGGTASLVGHTSTSITYSVHKDIVVPSGVSCCCGGAVDNTATFQPQNVGNTPSNSSSVTTHVCVTGHDLTIAKTVTPSYTRTYTWTIDKKVNGKDNDGPTSLDQPTAPAHYTVTTTKTGVNHAYKLGGTLTVTNPNSFAVAGATVTDTPPAGFACTVQNNGAVGSIPANSSATLTYSCLLGGSGVPTTGTNNATVSWTSAMIPNDPSGKTSASASASFDFSQATVTVEHNAVDVIDTNVANPLATNVTAGATYTYDTTIPVPNFACTTTPNTATVTDTGLPGSVLASDTASITLCRTQQGLALSKTATPGFTRSYEWSIAKSVDQTSVTTSADTATFNYTVAVTKSAPTDSGWAVTGTITVVNPNVYTVDNVLVTEQGVNNGGICTLDQSGAIGTLTQGQTGVVTYTCTYAAAPSPAAGTNTANVTWTLPPNGAPAGTPQSGNVSQAFVFGDPTTTLHDTVNVSDLFDGAAAAPLVGGANLNASKTFFYSRTVAVPTTDCHVYNNTANVTAVDAPGYSKDSSASVQVCRQAPPTPPSTPVAPAVVKTSTPPSRTTISLHKRAASPTVKAGGTVAFTITWKNTGKAAARNVVICDDLPNHLTFVSATGAAFKNGKACWTRKSVAKGATLTFRVVARVNASVGNAQFVNVATATASNAKSATAKAPVRALRNARTRAGGVTG